MALQSYFTTPFTVSRMSTPDGAWGHESSEGQVASAKGWIQPGSGKPVMRDGKEMAVSTHLLLCNCNVDIRPMDVVFTDNGTYKVLFVGNAAGMGHHLEVDLELKR